LRIQWTGFRPLFDFWGQEIKRFYKVETLASAVEYMIRTRDTFIIPSIQQVLGPSPVVTLTFELFQEGKYQFIFRLRAANARRNMATFAFVAAKRHDEFSAVAAVEHKNLRILQQRAPTHVVRPFDGGLVYLPDRHQRAGHGREVYCYLTQWLAGFDELGIGKNLQFIINVKARHTFTIEQTEKLKAQMVEIMARTYDARDKSVMDLPQIASGDFVVSSPKRGDPRLRLIACRNILRHVTPAKLIHKMATALWDWGGADFYFAPSDPDLFYRAIVRARGEEEAREWIGQYRAQLKAGAFRQTEVLPKDYLDTL
jgi:hypothetical protein